MDSWKRPGVGISGYQECWKEDWVWVTGLK